MFLGTQSPCTGVLLVVAARGEADAIRAAFGVAQAGPNCQFGGWEAEQLAAGVDLIETGVGKAQAAGGTVRALDPKRHGGVISIGLAGALPGGHPPEIGEAVLAERSLFADEGVRTPEGFIPIGRVGFPPGSVEGGFAESGMRCAPAWFDALRRVCDRAGPIATVSACSGKNEWAEDVAARTEAIAENMEGAAVAAALSRLPAPPLFAEIRVISNTTGDRDQQKWDLDRALPRLGEVARLTIEALRGS